MNLPFVLPVLPHGLNRPLVICACAIIFAYASKNLFVRSVIGAAIAIWLFFQGYAHMVDSKWLQ